MEHRLLRHTKPKRAAYAKVGTTAKAVPSVRGAPKVRTIILHSRATYRLVFRAFQGNMEIKPTSIRKRWLAKFVRMGIYAKVVRTVGLVSQGRTVMKQIIHRTVVGVKRAKKDTGVRVRIRK